MSLPDRTTPVWAHPPAPADAPDPALAARIAALCAKLPAGLHALRAALDGVGVGYAAAATQANAAVWAALDALVAGPAGGRHGLVAYAGRHLPPRAAARVFRRLAADPDAAVRRAVRAAVAAGATEVTVPRAAGGAWDATNWAPPAGRPPGRPATGVPAVATVRQLRDLLGIRSPRQLGYLLLANAEPGGPYRAFTIPKRDGTARTIHAPGSLLKLVQRRILDLILAKVPPHPAAHGFVPGRSTVTNAAPHVGRGLVVKFDLADFFPTVRYFRVVGLFAGLGYPVGDRAFGTADEADRVAPTLARLCCLAPAGAWAAAALPQGAPTSPAAANLVCRRLDARLAGLAARAGGVYTRYADDLTFSFPTPGGVRLGRLRWWVDQLCQQEGFVVNQRKFRVARASRRQTVTGLVVNEAVGVPRELRRRFRAILHNCGVNGVAAEARGDPRFRDYVRGFAAYLNMVRPAAGQAVLARVAALMAAADPGPPAPPPPETTT